MTVKPDDKSLSSNHATGVRKSRGFASPLAPDDHILVMKVPFI